VVALVDDEAVRKTTLREVKILRMLRHKTIVELREAFRRKEKLYLVFEYVQALSTTPPPCPPPPLTPSLKLPHAPSWCHRHPGLRWVLGAGEVVVLHACTPGTHGADTLRVLFARAAAVGMWRTTCWSCWRSTRMVWTQKQCAASYFSCVWQLSIVIGTASCTEVRQRTRLSPCPMHVGVVH
jgi:hypothetical protein